MEKSLDSQVEGLVEKCMQKIREENVDEKQSDDIYKR